MRRKEGKKEKREKKRESQREKEKEGMRHEEKKEVEGKKEKKGKEEGKKERKEEVEAKGWEGRKGSFTNGLKFEILFQFFELSFLKSKIIKEHLNTILSHISL